MFLWTFIFLFEKLRYRENFFRKIGTIFSLQFRKQVFRAFFKFEFLKLKFKFRYPCISKYNTGRKFFYLFFLKKNSTTDILLGVFWYIENNFSSETSEWLVFIFPIACMLPLSSYYLKYIFLFFTLNEHYMFTFLTAGKRVALQISDISDVCLISNRNALKWS